MKFLLVGNYGVGNLGDELLREYFLKTFSEVEWTVVVADAGCRLQVADTTIPRLPFGLRSLLTTPWWRTIKELWRCDGMVFGGGTLFTDIESPKAPMLWWWHAFFAWIFRKKIILAFQGIGPFRTRVGEWCGRWVTKRAELTIVRDAESFQRIASWKNKRCVQSFDPVLSLFAEEKPDTSGKVFVVIPRANTTQEFRDRVLALWEQRRGEWAGVRVVSLEPEHAAEKEICAFLARTLQAPVACITTYDALKDALQDAALVLTQRYHGGIAAMGMGIRFEVVPQQAGDKLAAIQGVDRGEALQRIRVGERALREAFHL